jgi:hypothetical protein
MVLGGGTWNILKMKGGLKYKGLGTPAISG